MTHPALRWTVRADRRTADFEAVRAELLSLAETLVGLEVELVDRLDFDAATDAGAFRDFVPIAVARAPDLAILEAMAEELLLEFGYRLDVLPMPP